MCGIIGYIGSKEAYPILIEGLYRLEYRGYDSAGIALFNHNKINISKTKGKVSQLEKNSKKQNISGQIGMGHTRWATHGEPNDINAHPHLSNSGQFAIIHNGIIENYEAIKEELTKRGYTFSSETDTEVLANLIEDSFKTSSSLKEAIQTALNQVIGAYAIVVMDRNNPNTLGTAKLGSPLAIGIGEDENFIASDASPFIKYTNNVVYLEDGQMAMIKKDNIQISEIANGSSVKPYVQELQLKLEEIEKAEYDHFMIKEIFEQPQAIKNCLRGRILAGIGKVKMSSIEDHLDRFLSAKKIIIIACGTAWHSALVGKHLIENFVKIPVEVDYASEFRYRNPIISEDDVVIIISQSGETADSIAALKLAKQAGAFVYGICNVVGSSISRMTDSGAYTHAGPEIGVASTKAFTTQLTTLALIAFKLGGTKETISKTELFKYLQELEGIPDKVSSALKLNEKIFEISKKYKDSSNMVFLGKTQNFPIALEGALKLKEISYIHAEGLPSGEMKHGHIALLNEKFPVIVIATKGKSYEKCLSSIQEAKARKARVLAIVTKGDQQVSKIADDIIEVPEVTEMLSPILNTVPLQLLSYHIGVLRGCNVDQPRNLAKSVTVE